MKYTSGISGRFPKEGHSFSPVQQDSWEQQRHNIGDMEYSQNHRYQDDRCDEMQLKESRQKPLRRHALFSDIDEIVDHEEVCPPVLPTVFHISSIGGKVRTTPTYVIYARRVEK